MNCFIDFNRIRNGLPELTKSGHGAGNKFRLGIKITPFALLVMLLFVLQPGELAGQETQRERISIEGTTMGPIPYHITVANPPAELNEERLAAAIATTLERINRLMSTYRPDSDVSRFNQLDATEWLDVDAETARVVSRALELSELSEGAFDITVAPAVNRWRFGPDKSEEDFRIPGSDELAQLKSTVGYRSIELRLNPPALRKSNPRASIDLSAIAKGYAVDAAAQTLAELGCQNFMVEVGGETIVKGERPGGGKWRIGIETPAELSANQVDQVLELTDLAIATSGDYRNYRAIGGKRYSHTIDPRTCAPVENRVASATVIAEDCMTADGVATALMVLGPEQGLELCRKMNWQALIKVRDLEFGDKFTNSQTAGFPPTRQLNPVAQAMGEGDEDTATAQIWPVFLAAIIVFVLAILAMATGAIFGKKPIAGSCGGLANQKNTQGESVCGVCSQPADQCPEETVKNSVQ